MVLCLPAFASSRNDNGSSFKFGQAGDFDRYTLEMSYEPDFCASHQDKPECQRALPAAMTLHGLWPDRDDDPRFTYSLCGLNQDPLPKHDWCGGDIDVRGQMSGEVFAALVKVMPAADGSCLYNHEWYKHGTCSGLSVDAYFQESSTLASRFEGFNTFNTFLRQSAGQQVSLAALRDALAADMGQEGMSSVTFICRKQRNQPYFSAVDLILSKDNYGDFPAPSSFAGQKGPVANTCPSMGITITPQN